MSFIEICITYWKHTFKKEIGKKANWLQLHPSLPCPSFLSDVLILMFACQQQLWHVGFLLSVCRSVCPTEMNKTSQDCPFFRTGINVINMSQVKSPTTHFLLQVKRVSQTCTVWCENRCDCIAFLKVLHKWFLYLGFFSAPPSLVFPLVKKNSCQESFLFFTQSW